jgi:tellurite resistance protein TehA-like permease
LKNPKRSFGFLTFVVGTATLGVQFLMVEFIGIGKALWFIAFFGWFIFMYSIFMYFINLTAEPVENSISGTTLLTTLSTQSIAVLGSLLVKHFGISSNIVLFISWIYWSAGFVLYIIVIILVTYRLFFRVMKPKDWTDPYWICMGAVAITTLAGANLVMNMNTFPTLNALSSSTVVITFLAWAIGTWWIPIKIFMDIWKFVQVNISNKVPSWIKIFLWLRLGFVGKNYHFYEPMSWGRVFPIGMYTARTITLSKASKFEFLFLIPKYWGWLALTVWFLTFIGTIWSLLK